MKINGKKSDKNMFTTKSVLFGKRMVMYFFYENSRYVHKTHILHKNKFFAKRKIDPNVKLTDSDKHFWVYDWQSMVHV